MAAACLVVVQAPTGPAQAADDRPNVVFITTDDQRTDDLRHMPFTKRLIGRRGYTFTRAMSPHPLCCPARAEWMTGQYGHNNGVRHNTGPHGGFKSLVEPGNNIGTWLKAAGYRTAMVGKFMNGYQADAGRVAGWDHWNPTIHRKYSYSGTTFFDDGAATLHEAHVDDVTLDYASQYVREFAGGNAPFFIWASNLAPHGGRRDGRWVGAIPAERHRGVLDGVQNPALEHPGYNVKDDFSVKTGVDGDVGQVKRRLTRRKGNRLHQLRVESLQAVDEGVREVVKTLGETGELDNTYIVFTSDNGYLLGEHKLLGKNYFYNESLQVPLLVRGPGVDEGRRSSRPVTAVDLVPTLAELAGAEPGRVVDGKSFLPILQGQTMRWRRHQLVQAGAGTERGWIVRGVRTSRWAYAKNFATGREQLINLKRDPYEMRNLAGRRDHRSFLRNMRRAFRTLRSCAGPACH